MATVAIGDIHGNLKLLNQLLNKVLPGMCPQDTLVFLGDYIDRGADSKGCVERIVNLRREASFSVITLLGNHEQWMLRSFDNLARHSWLVAMEGIDTVRSYSEKAAVLLSQGLAAHGANIYTERVDLPYEEFFEAIPPAHLRFFQDLKPFHKTEDAICVHGGVDPAGALDSPDPETYIWGPSGFPEDYRGSGVVVYGHHDDAVMVKGYAPGVRIGSNRTYGIDTISHGVLTAIRFPEGTVFQSGFGN